MAWSKRNSNWGIEIGEGAVIASQSLVNKDIPLYQFGGVPQNISKTGYECWGNNTLQI